MHASPALLALALAVLAATAMAKVYTPCELAQELKNKYGIPRSELPDWLCLVKSESAFKTDARNVNIGPPPSVDLGIFQINDYFWCDESPPKGTNDCGIKCSVLSDSNIADDVNCALKVKARHGFDAWYGWKKNCKGKNLSSYLAGCSV